MALSLSFSQISTYLECPYRYYLSYIIKLPGLPKPYFSFGSSIHSALEKLHKPRLIPEKSSLSQLVTWYEESWVSDGYADIETEAKAKEEGKALLVSYFEKYGQSIVPAVDVEKRFKLMMGEITINGVIDRIDRGEDDKLRIIDYKTGNYIPIELGPAEKLQLTIYTIAVGSIYQNKVEKATYLYLKSSVEMSFVPSDDDLASAINTIETVASQIKEGIFPRCKNKFCPWCDYYQSCNKTSVIHVKEGF